MGRRQKDRGTKTSAAPGDAAPPNDRGDEMNRSTAGGAAFVTAGVAFIALGSSGQRAFLPIGLAFVVIGVVSIVRQRRRR
jgi:hypothetical protein